MKTSSKPNELVPEVGALIEDSACSNIVADNGDWVSASGNEDWVSDSDNEDWVPESEGHLVTSRLKRHFDCCKPYQQRKARKYENSFDQNNFCSMMAETIMHHGYSLKMVEDKHYRELLSYLNPNVKHITRDTILKHCTTEHEKLKAQLCQLLSEVPGKICFTCDSWYACSSRGYLVLTAHFVDKSWTLRSKVLSFRFCQTPHNGADIYRFVLNIIDEWHLKGKAFSMTVGDAGDMDAMIEHLKKDLHSTCALPCGGKFFHIRGADQVLNFIVQSGMKLIDESVIKLRETVKYIEYHDSTLARFEQAIRDSHSNFSGKLRLDVPTQWDSTYLMLCQCLEAKAPIDKFASQEIGFEYFLLKEEWEAIRNMRDFLKPFYNITLLFSGSEYPTANLYFAYITAIKYVLAKAKNDSIGSIREMAALMLQRFEKYWDNYSSILSIAVLLDPRHKLRYVEYLYGKLYAGQEYDDKVKAVYDTFTELYTFYENFSTPSSVQTRALSTPSISSSDLCPFWKNFFQVLDEEEEPESRGTKFDIDTYLYSPRVPRNGGVNFDVLQYWKSQIDYPSFSPALAHMARDVLAIPITSFASESSFSMGGRVLTKLRSSDMPENMEVFVTVQNRMFGYGEVEEIL